MTVIAVNLVGISNEFCTPMQHAHTQVIIAECLAEFPDMIMLKQLDIGTGMYLVFQLTVIIVIGFIED